MRFTTVRLCAECRQDSHSVTEAEWAEGEWAKHPREVEEKECPSCLRVLHWWYFWVW